jgi:hypothetical protein
LWFDNLVASWEVEEMLGGRAYLEEVGHEGMFRRVYFALDPFLSLSFCFPAALR